ncbi:hypothetical protein BDY19DRAFT_964916 [Irpex rosettiformis]|uniref:Uncharacterized protein n=1 Tax=Irpex rosettiformis TaxID=378272 RepID=A0ACB8TUC7_9APHY|nr:hypothetical protein BDY19DRAFT_964916 [Irpex rosettiformis]
MNSDEYFDDLDSAFLQEVDAIEAIHTQLKPTRTQTPTRLPQTRPSPAKRPIRSDVIEIDDSDDFGSFFIDEQDLEIIDKLTNEALQSRPSIAGPGRTTFARTSSRATLQTTLDGSILSESERKNSSSSRQSMQRNNSNVYNGFVGQSRTTKQWDRTAFAKSGWRKPQNAKGKEKALGSFDEEIEDEEEGEPEEFEQFPSPCVSVGYPPPMKLEADRLAARRWIYPLNQSRRDYQFNIVRRCLFDNTLVALPTGLGKTFIAGVVMLNFYTWFPEGKVVFVAPTKPLVAQQIEACHKTCGIPGSDAAELTGQNPRPVRARAWQEKRVFYMTPQTLMNDLRSDNCDPRDIILLVIDEAHKGTGDYAYAQVIRYLMAKNPHFRVLALTATPGSKPEAVQAVVDSLHISHIEIRDEQSLDLARYLHKKHIEKHIIAMSEEVITVRDMLAEVMTPMIQKLFNAKLLIGNPNPVSLHPFSCTKSISGLAGRRDRNNFQWAFSMLSSLGTLARIMGYLIEGSMLQCHRALSDFVTGAVSNPELSEKSTASKSKSKKFQKDPKLLEVLQELESLKTRSGGFPVHPKMDKMKTLLVEYFAQKRFDKEDAVANGSGEDISGDSRVMIFVSFRQGVDEVVAFLNDEKPLIRAIPFIGQGTDKLGNKGYGQKEQLDIIKRFKAGEFNVLVSTSIGEEGLDIGEIDMIICYDSQKTPIRMLQRIGRTGRKREGYVHVLLSEEREERNWDKADDNYKDVQRFIIKAEQLELYDDVERLIPDNIKPECVEMVMDIEEYVRSDPNLKKGLKTAKRVRNDDVMRNIPAGASTSFISVKDLLQKGSKKRKKVAEFDEEAGEDDSDDREITAGVTANLRRTLSAPDSTAQRKKKMRRTATVPKSSSKVRTTKKQTQEVTPRDFDEAGLDDSDDEAIGGGVFTSAKHVLKNGPKAQKGKKSATSSLTTTYSPPRTPPQTEQRLSSIEIPSPPDRPLSEQHTDQDDHNEDVRKVKASVQATPSSRDLAEVSVIDLTTPAHQESSPEFCWSSPEPIVDGPPSAQKPNIQTNSSMAWLLDDDDEPPFQVVGSSPVLDRVMNLPSTPDGGDSEPEIIDGSRASPARSSRALHPRINETSHCSPRPSRNKSSGKMQPPALPVRLQAPTKHAPSPSHLDDHNMLSPPPSTFAVRAPGGNLKKRENMASFDSSPIVAAPAARRRLHRQRSQEFFQPIASPKPVKKKKRRFADVVEAQRHNPWIDVEASHSGDENSAGSEDEEALSESDRQFIADHPPTQASPSYDQTAVYRRSLMTQVPGGNMPVFANKPFRGKGAAYGGHSRPGGKAILSSSPPPEEGSDDYYEYGSFVVDDDAEISYVDDSQRLSDL